MWTLRKKSGRARASPAGAKILSRGRFFRRPAKKIRPSSWPARPAAKCRDRIFISQGAKKIRPDSWPARPRKIQPGEKSSQAENPANLAAPPGGEAGPGTRVPVATFLHDLLVLAWTSRGRCEKIRPGQGQPGGCEKSYHDRLGLWTLRKKSGGRRRNVMIGF